MTSPAVALLDRLARSSAIHRSYLEAQSRSHAAFLDMCSDLAADAAWARVAPRCDPELAQDESVIDPSVDTWLRDHCPSWTIPAMPMMSIVDRLAQAAAKYAGTDVVALIEVQLLRWLPVNAAVHTRTQVTPSRHGMDVELWAWRTATTATLSRFELVAKAAVWLKPETRPAPLPYAPLTEAVVQPDPYASGMLFHGPSFQYLTSWSLSEQGASGVLEAGRGGVPRGSLHQGLLDGALHVIPAQKMWTWAPEIGRAVVAIPHRLDWLHVYEPLPDCGPVRVEARFNGFDGGELPLPVVDVQLLYAGSVAVAFRLVLGLLRLGPLAGVTPANRRAFLGDRKYVPGVGLTRQVEQQTILEPRSVRDIDWPPGAVADIYALRADLADRIAVIAAKEHLAHALAVHPAAVEVADDLRTAWVHDRPTDVHPISVTSQNGHVHVSSTDRIST